MLRYDRAARTRARQASPGASGALRLMGLSASAARHTLVVGDDPALEMRMARSAGAGDSSHYWVERSRVVRQRGPAEALDAVLDDLAPLVALLSDRAGRQTSPLH
jgi:hypothetical protein